MEAAQQTESIPPTPEQLLKLLDLQLERERGQRGRKTRNRATFLATGILFIIAAGGIALLVAQQLLADLHDRDGLPPLAGEVSGDR